MDEIELADAGDTAMPRLESITLIDVARVAGVAPMTVSRALHRPELVRSETHRKVLDAVKKTGYVPNMLAAGLTSSKSRLVAILLPTIANSIFSDTVQSLMDHLTASGYQSLLGLTGYSVEREEELLSTLLGRRPDAIVLAGSMHSEVTIQRLARARIPVVEIWDLPPAPLDMVVGFSHEQVGIAIARHLVEKQYKHFGIICLDDVRGLRRCRSVAGELARRGFADVPFETVHVPATLAGGRAGLRRLLDKQHVLDVVVCSSDTVAQGVLAEAASRGMQVPQALAVMGFGDLNTAAEVFPALSTVRIDGEKIGKATAEEILKRLDGNVKASRRNVARIDVGFEIIARDSA
jgi:LacI family gluconate utilization system Gnt-I transcriptional repressor